MAFWIGKNVGRFNLFRPWKVNLLMNECYLGEFFVHLKWVVNNFFNWIQCISFIEFSTLNTKFLFEGNKWVDEMCEEGFPTCALNALYTFYGHKHFASRAPSPLTTSLSYCLFHCGDLPAAPLPKASDISHDETSTPLTPPTLLPL